MNFSKESDDCFRIVCYLASSDVICDTYSVYLLNLRVLLNIVNPYVPSLFVY